MLSDILQFVQDHGAQRVITVFLIGLSLVAISVYYKYKPDKFLLHLIYTHIGLIIFFPAYNYSIDYIEVHSAIANADPSLKQELLNESYKIMQWHIWFPAVFIVPSLILMVSVKLSKK